MMMTNVATYLPRDLTLAAALTARGAGLSGGGGDARGGTRQPDAARRILEHVRRRMAHVELAEFPFVANTHDDQVDFAFERFVDDCRANVAGLQNLGFELYAKFIRHVFGAPQDSVTLGRFRRQI